MITFITLYIFNFLRTILIIVILYYAIRLVSRYLFPLLINKGVKNMQQKMQDQQRSYQKPQRPEGEVTIENNPQRNQKNNPDKGEYIDFEEVE
ncbi:MAG TPA: DUF4834 family protein [Draconibacterium sp.]|nr:DUF4834 family protein [Draconibacterium sp.]